MRYGLAGWFVALTLVLGFTGMMSGQEAKKDPPPEPKTAPAEKAEPAAVETPKTPEELEALLIKLEGLTKGDKPDKRAAESLLKITETLKDPKFVPVLTKYLLGAHTWPVRLACVNVLANVDTPESTKSLAGFIRFVPDLNQPNMTPDKTGFWNLYDVYCCEKSAVKTFEVLVARGRFLEIREDIKRLGAIEIMASAGKPGLEELLEMEQDARKGIGEREIDTLLVGRAIAKVRSADCLELLRITAQDEERDEAVRRGAIEALADGWGLAEYPTIISVARHEHDKNQSVRMCAYTCATKLDPKNTHDELVPLLKERQYVVRGTAAFLLGTTGDKTLIPQIEALLDDENDGVRLQAFEGLWLLDYTKREVVWKDPRRGKQNAEVYKKWCDSHPKPETAGKEAP